MPGCKVGFEVKAEEVHWPGREACEAARGFAAANDEELMWRGGERRRDNPPLPVEVSERV